MSDEALTRLMLAIRDFVRPHLERSEEAREVARRLGEWLLEESARSPGAVEEPASAPPPPAAPAAPDEPAPKRPLETRAASTRPVSRGIVPLRIGDASVHIEVAGETETLGRARQAAQVASDDHDTEPRAENNEIDLELIVTRCRLKADSCRHFISRRAAIGDPDAERPVLATMESMIAKAKSLRDCFLWVFWRERIPPGDQALRSIARCYDALADATDLVRTLTERADQADLNDAFQLMATANSALRVSLQDAWMTSPDTDQDESHLWLRHECAVRRIYIARHMTLADAADPSDIGEVAEDIHRLRDKADTGARRSKVIDQAFKRIVYHCRQIALHPGDPDEHHLQKIGAAIDALAEQGVRASDPRYTERLSEAVAVRLLDHASPAVRDAARRAHRASGNAEETAEPGPATRGWSERVLELRSILADTAIVVVGGEPRPDAIDRIKDAFALREVEWVRLTEHGTGEPMRAPISRTGVSLVVVLIKLAGHLHADEARRYAADASKPCVFLPAGYNPEQIADAALQQASERLRAGKTGEPLTQTRG